MTRYLLLLTLLLAPACAARAGTVVLTPVSGADGAFDTRQVNGQAVWRSAKDDKGACAMYMYFKAPDGFPKQLETAYFEFTYRDTGPGALAVQYNSGNGNAYRLAPRGFGRGMTGSGAVRTAVFELSAVSFHGGQNVGADLRIMGPGGAVPLEVISATLSTEPTPLFRQHSARPWLEPYRGPRRSDVDATTLKGKVMCGYQGWFRCPGDPADSGWVHWSRDASRIAPDTLTFEMWPDMTDYPKDTQFPAPGFTYPDGKQATLFSAADPRVVDLHFDWMRQYGIDGVWVQRFVVGVDGGAGSAETARVLGYVRNAANRTGRTFAIEYDMSGMPADAALVQMRKDWRWLVDVMHVTDDPRYLHHNGKPVLAVFAFYKDRFSGKFANDIIDAFQTNDRYGVSLVGAGAWFWRDETDPEWRRAYRRFTAYSPWNVGNWAQTPNGKAASTGWWADDLAEATRAGMLYLPVLYPGFSWDNLTRAKPGSSLIPRRNGDFLREQFQVTKQLGITQAFVAMFDEVDEGTAIFKVTSTPPTQAHFIGLEGQPSDLYLRIVGEGTKLIHGRP